MTTTIKLHELNTETRARLEEQVKAGEAAKAMLKKLEEDAEPTTLTGWLTEAEGLMFHYDHFEYTSKGAPVIHIPYADFKTILHAIHKALDLAQKPESNCPKKPNSSAPAEPSGNAGGLGEQPDTLPHEDVIAAYDKIFEKHWCIDLDVTGKAIDRLYAMWHSRDAELKQPEAEPVDTVRLMKGNSDSHWLVVTGDYAGEGEPDLHVEITGPKAIAEKIHDFVCSLGKPDAEPVGASAVDALNEIRSRLALEIGDTDPSGEPEDWKENHPIDWAVWRASKAISSVSPEEEAEPVGLSDWHVALDSYAKSLDLSKEPWFVSGVADRAEGIYYHVTVWRSGQNPVLPNGNIAPSAEPVDAEPVGYVKPINTGALEYYVEQIRNLVPGKHRTAADSLWQAFYTVLKGACEPVRETQDEPGSIKNATLTETIFRVRNAGLGAIADRLEELARTGYGSNMASDALYMVNDLKHTAIAFGAANGAEGAEKARKAMHEAEDKLEKAIIFGHKPDAEPVGYDRQPDGYAYRYRDGIRHNFGQEVNGSKPLESIPYYYRHPAPVSKFAANDALMYLIKEADLDQCTHREYIRDFDGRRYHVIIEREGKN